MSQKKLGTPISAATIYARRREQARTTQHSTAALALPSPEVIYEERRQASGHGDSPREADQR